MVTIILLIVIHMIPDGANFDITDTDFCEVFVLPITENLVAFYEKSASLQVYVYPLPEDCQAIDRNNITWVKVGGSLPISRIEMTYSEEDTLATLKMRALETSDLGTYRCEVNYQSTVYTSEDIILDLRRAPEVEPVDAIVTAVLGTTASFHVVVTADPEATPQQIVWGTLRIEWDSSRFIVGDDSRFLEVRNVTKADSEGYFSCEVRTEYANDRAYMRLVVVELPVITPSSSDEILSVFHELTLSCEADGDPPPEISWEMPDATQVPGGNLTVTQEGNYTCRALNVAGRDEKLFIVLQGLSPTITGLPDFQYVKELGMEVEVQCSAEGTPQPSVSWLFQGNIVSMSDTLVLPVLLETQLGSYTCEAKNAGGMDTANITVKLADKPSVTLSRYSVNASVGTDVTVECSATGEPASTIQWVSTNWMALLHPTLDLLDLDIEDTGNYTCVADNGYHQTTMVFDLFVYEHPKAIVLSDSLNLTKGERLEISCHAEGVPTPSVTMNKGGSDGNIGSRDDEGVVRVVRESASLSDAGTYSCTAVNEFGENSVIIDVAVYSAPYFDEPFNTTSLNGTVGQDVLITCKILGFPDPNPLVYLEHLPLTEDELQETPSDLQKNLLEDQEDFIFKLALDSSITRAKVTCIGTNVLGEVKESREIYAYAPFTLLGNATLEESVYIETVDYQTSCPVEGHPPPDSFTWILPDGSVSTQELLTIDKFGFEDEGNYTCTVRNGWGMSMTVTIKLSVDYEKPNVTVEFKDVPVGQVGMITCIGHGRPLVTLTMFHGETPVTNVTTHVESDPSLGWYVVLTYTYLMSEDLVGEWSCSGGNTIGDTAYKNITLQYYSEAKVSLSTPMSRTSRYNETKPTNMFCNITGVPLPYTTILINGVNSTSGSNTPGIVVTNLGDGVYNLVVLDTHLGTTNVECSAVNAWGSDRDTTRVTTMYTLSCYKCVTKVCASTGADISVAHIIAVYPNPNSVEWSVTGVEGTVNNDAVNLHNTSIQIDPGFIEYEAFVSSIGSEVKAVHFMVDDGASPMHIQTDLEIYEPISAVLFGPASPVLPGTNVTITATITADPYPDMRWLINGYHVTDQSHDITFDDGTITLLRVQGGTRHVVALELLPLSSCHTARSQSVTVTVLGESPPRIYNLPRYIEKREGEKLDLLCKATGDPQPTVDWYKRKSTASTLKSSGVLESFLTVEAMSQEEAGTWECRATNEAGQSDVKFVELILKSGSVGAQGSSSSPAVILSTLLTVAFVVLVGPLILAVYCKKRKLNRETRLVTPVTDSGFEERASMEKEIRKLVTPEFYDATQMPTKTSFAEEVTPNPALFALPSTKNRLPPLPRRCNSAHTVRSLADNSESRPQTVSPPNPSPEKVEEPPNQTGQANPAKRGPVEKTYKLLRRGFSTIT